MSGKINSHICLMLSVYKSFHQTVKYGQQINHILQDLTDIRDVPGSIFYRVLGTKAVFCRVRVPGI